MGLEQVHELASFINEHGKLGVAIFEYYGSDLEDARRVLADGYCGCYSSLADFAQGLTEETSEVPDHLATYIDYERMGRDTDLSGDILTIETAHDEVHVF